MPSLTDIVRFRPKPKPAANSSASTSSTPTPLHRQSLPAGRGRPLSAISTRHYDHLIGELRCPGCTRPLSAPIRLCPTGHSCCSDCSGRLAGCPVCGQPLTLTRSLALETVASRAAFSCANAPQGCPVRLAPLALREHQLRCVYQMGDCFMGRVWGGCEWTGRELDWLRHCRAEHGDRMFEGAEQELRWTSTSYERKQKPLAAYYMFRVFGETFNLYQVWDALTQRIAWTVICASKDPRVGERFAFEVELRVPGDGGRRRHRQRHGVHGERAEDVLREGRCASFEAAEVQRFVDAYRVLHYRVRIIEIQSPQLSPSSRRAAAILAGEDATVIEDDPLSVEPPAKTEVPEAQLRAAAQTSSSASSIVAIDAERPTPPDSADESSSFEHVHRVRAVELPAPVAPFVREFDSPTLVAKVAKVPANQVPKPPRHSLERGAEAPRAEAEDDAAEEDEEVSRLLQVAPLPPTTPVPKSDASIVFAKTNVNEN